MMRYRYFFLVGLILHLTVIYIIVNQPTSKHISYYIQTKRKGQTDEKSGDEQFDSTDKYSSHENLLEMADTDENSEQSTKIIDTATNKQSVKFQSVKHDNVHEYKETIFDETLLQKLANESSKQLPKKFNKMQGIYVFGTFLDKRLDGEPMVRILALQKLKDKDSLVCLFQTSQRYFITYTEKYELCENHGKVYGGYMYSCSIPKHFIGQPDHVTLTMLTEDEQMETIYYNFKLTTLHKISNNDNVSIAVCLSPLYGDISNSQIIQFMDLVKILQASKVFVYKSNITKSTEMLLNYYSAENFVKINDWLIPEHIQDQEIWSKGQLLANQECLYSNMNTYKYLLFLDLDEMLVPKNSYSWIEMLQKFETNPQAHSAAGFSFQSAFFDPKHHSESDQNIEYLQLYERSATTSDMRSKVVVQPTHIFEVGIHHISRTLDDAYTSININQSTALIHHYRACVSNFDQTMQCNPTVKDMSMLKYADNLRKSVTNTQQIVNEIYSHLQNITYLGSNSST